VGPEHAYLADIGRVTYEPITDSEAMDAFKLLCRTEGIIPAIESSHALAGAIKVGKRLTEGSTNPSETVVIVNLSGRGDKDVETAAEWFDMLDEEGKVKGTNLSTRKPKGPADRAETEAVPSTGAPAAVADKSVADNTEDH
jgi:tryptophan synthase beta chain